MARTRVCVLAPTPQLTVTVEAGPDGDDIHVHPGGQGLWLARMATALGARVVVCGPFGGETGAVARHLAEQEGIHVRATPAGLAIGGYVHDRRDGDRAELARMAPVPPSRHDLDDLYGATLVEALDAQVLLVSGPEPDGVVDGDFYARLVRDVRAAGTPVVADLSGEPALAVAEAGVDVLKMSHTELAEAGLARGESRAALVTAARRLVRGGVAGVVVTRADDPALVVTADEAHELVSPQVSTVDHRGAGDSLTAATGVGLARGRTLVEAVRLGVAAGALNVTRHGLGTGSRAEIERFAREVVARRLPDPDPARAGARNGARDGAPRNRPRPARVPAGR